MLRLRDVILIGLLVLLGLTSAFACGDKLIMGHGINFSAIHRSSHPASVLIYMNPGSRLPAAEKDVQLQSALLMAGHKPKSIENRTEFLRALTSGGYDVVVADFADAQGLKSEVAGASGKPMLLPVLYKPSKDQMAAAQKQFSCSSKADQNQILKVLDEAMKSKQKGAAPQCQAL